MSTRYGSRLRTAGLLAAALFLSRCDLPTEPPKFSVNTGIRAPLLVDKTFVLIGPSDSGHEALIDTTSHDFASLFTVAPADQALSVVQEIEGFDLGGLVDVMPTITVDPVDVEFSLTTFVGVPFVPPGGVSFSFVPAGEAFSGGYEIDVATDRLGFAGEEDFVAIHSGALEIDALTNEIDVDLDVLQISIPSLRRYPYGAADSLVIRFEGSVADPDRFVFPHVARQSGPRDQSIDLSGFRLYPNGSRIDYHVFGEMETAGDVRTVRADEDIRFGIGLADLLLQELSADIEPFTIALSDDRNGDRRLDVLDDDEAQVADFGGLDLFDKLNVEGFQLSGSELSLNVRTDIGADVSLYAAIAGETEDGSLVYLEGRGDLAVAPSDSVASTFVAGGAAVPVKHMVRLHIEGAPEGGDSVVRTFVFDRENSNVDAFISAVPTTLRYVAKVLVQPNGGHAHLREPILLETSLGASIPLAVSGGFSLGKTFKADMSGLDDVVSDEEYVSLDRAELHVGYENGFPLGLDVHLDVLDADGAVLVTFPSASQSMSVKPAATDDAGRATSAGTGTFDLSIAKTDLEAMARGHEIRLRLEFTTDLDRRAQLRASDTFTVRLSGNIGVAVGTD